jgi:RimJ/RimL family protein N-acetyltransferase
VITASSIRTPRLRLEPLTVRDTDVLFPVLNDPALHTFTGGEPRTRAELEAWIAAVEPGRSPDGSQSWCNWVVVVIETGSVAGTVQATVEGDDASLAWVIGAAFQGQGYAKEAAAGIASWLADRGVTRFRATIHPDHAASGTVADSLGMQPTDELVDGEVVWRSTGSPATDPTAAG